MQHAGLVAHAGERVVVHLRCEVHDRARRGRAGDALDLGDVAAVGVPHALRLYAWDPPLGCGHHLRRRWGTAFEDAQEVCGGSAAQHCAVSAGLYRRQVPRFEREHTVASAVDAPVDADEQPNPHAVADLLRRDAGGDHLRPGDDSMLRTGDPGDDLLNSPD